MKRCSTLIKLKAVFDRGILLIIAISLSIGLYGQDKRSVSGIVKDPDGAPTPGVSVFVKGSTIGTITDVQGNYKLSIPKDAKILVFSFIGMNTLEKQIGSSAVIDVQLTAQVTQLDEMVVIAYGTKKKRDVIGSLLIQASLPLSNST